MTCRLDINRYQQQIDRLSNNINGIVYNLWSDTCGCLVKSQLACLSQNFIDQAVLSFVVTNEKTRQSKRREKIKAGVTWRDSLENVSLVDPVPEVDEDGPQAWLLTKLNRHDIVGDMIATARLLGSPDYNCKEKWDRLIESGDACYCIIYDTLRSHRRNTQDSIFEEYEN